MATLEEVYQKVLADEGERAAFVEAGGTAEGLEAFLRERGCEASLEEVGEFLEAKQAQQGELADEELDSVAGGGGCTPVEKVALSTFGIGLGCFFLLA